MINSNPYDKDEIDRIKKAVDLNDKMEDFFEKKREDWEKLIIDLFEKSKLDLDNPGSLSSVVDVESLSLSYRQRITDEINVMMNKRSIEDAKLKELKQQKFMFYATGFQLKTNGSEKNILIDGHIAQNERTKEIIESHIEYLRSCYDNLKSLNYSVKNMIELIKYLKSV